MCHLSYQKSLSEAYFWRSIEFTSHTAWFVSCYWLVLGFFQTVYSNIGYVGLGRIDRRLRIIQHKSNGSSSDRYAIVWIYGWNKPFSIRIKIPTIKMSWTATSKIPAITSSLVGSVHGQPARRTRTPGSPIFLRLNLPSASADFRIVEIET